MSAFKIDTFQSGYTAKRCAQVNFHTTMSGQAMVTMIYHRKLDAEWTAAAQKLRRVLGACPSSSQPAVHIIGRSRKQKIELDASYVMETLTVDGRQLTYKQVCRQLCYMPNAPESCTVLPHLGALYMIVMYRKSHDWRSAWAAQKRRCRPHVSLVTQIPCRSRTNVCASSAFRKHSL